MTKEELNYDESRKREAEQRRATEKRTAELAKIIKPLQESSYQADFEWNRIMRSFKGFEQDYGGFEFNPDFQRGHVWTPLQQQRYIESVLRGVVSSSGFVIQLNCPNWEEDNYQGDLPRGFQVIDGLQRLTAVQAFLDGTVKPFGLHVDDLNGSYFSVRGRYRFHVAVFCFTRRVDLLNHYLDFNSGGTPHSAEEIERVTKLRDEAAKSQ